VQKILNINLKKSIEMLFSFVHNNRLELCDYILDPNRHQHTASSC